MPLSDEALFRKNLDELGEEAVKRQLSRGIWNGQKVAVVELWLEERASARSERSNAASLKIARSAKNAAWAAAIAAAIANVIALIAIVISLRAWPF